MSEYTHIKIWKWNLSTPSLWDLLWVSVWPGPPIHRLAAKLEDFRASLSLTSSSTLCRSLDASDWDSSSKSPVRFKESWSASKTFNYLLVTVCFFSQQRSARPWTSKYQKQSDRSGVTKCLHVVLLWWWVTEGATRQTPWWSSSGFSTFRVIFGTAGSSQLNYVLTRNAVTWSVLLQYVI